MTVDYCYKYLQFLSRKNQTSAITPDEFGYAINTANRQYFDFLIGHVEQFEYGDATAKVALGMSSKISRDLSPFKVDSVTISVTSQLALYPTNYQFLAVMKDTSGRKIERIDDAKLPSRLSSVIDVITDSTKSFYVESTIGWTIYPNTVSSIVVNYYITPPIIVWAYNTVNNRAVYNGQGITTIPILYGGTGYTSPTISFSAPAAGGVQATGTVNVTGGVITGITITNSGTGYAGLTPTATLTGSGSTTAILGSPVISVDPLWDNVAMEEVLGRAARILGISFTEQRLVDYGNQVIERGE